MKLTFVRQTSLMSQTLSQDMQPRVFLLKLCGLTLVRRLLPFRSQSDDGFSDYMYKRRIFTVDPDYFPLDRMREIIDYLHTHQQRYGMFLFHLSSNQD